MTQLTFVSLLPAIPRQDRHRIRQRNGPCHRYPPHRRRLKLGSKLLLLRTARFHISHPARLLRPFPLAKYVSVNVMTWGNILACLAARKDFAGLMVCRALLGCAEAVIVPAWVGLRGNGIGRRTRIFGRRFGSRCVGQVFESYVAHGIVMHVGKDPHAGLRGWQIISPFLSLLTVVVGIAFLILPDSPLTASILPSEQKALHAEHVQVMSKVLDLKSSRKSKSGRHSPTQTHSFIHSGCLRQTSLTQSRPAFATSSSQEWGTRRRKAFCW